MGAMARAKHGIGGHILPRIPPLNPEQRAEWESAAAALGLKGYGTRMVGVLEGLPVLVERTATGDLHIAIDQLPDFLMTAAGGRGHERGVRTGDRSFDRQVFLSGNPVLVLTALDPGARHRILEALPLEPRLQDGTLHANPGFPKASSAAIERQVRALLRVATSLPDTAGTSIQAIGARLASEHAAEVRHALLESAIAAFGKDAQPLLREHLDDPQPSIALLAAINLPAEGSATTARIITQPDVSPSLRAKALGELLRRARPEALDLAISVLDEDYDDLLRVATKVIAGFAYVVAPEDRDRVSRRLVEILTQGPVECTPHIERTLVAMGSDDTLRHLLAIDTATLDRKRRAAVRAAIDAIRSRHDGVGGGLAVVASGGELSTGAAHGGLSRHQGLDEVLDVGGAVVGDQAGRSGEDVEEPDIG